MNSNAEAALEFTSRAEAPARSAWTVWLITAAIAVTIIALIIAAPLAQAFAHPQVASSIYKWFSFVCHQMPERSFYLAGCQFAVCSRCTGLYSGFAGAVLFYPVVRPLKSIDAPRRIWLILAAVPLAIDFSLGYFAIWPNTHLSRFATGALLGSVAVFFIMPGLIELSSAFGRRLAR